MCDCIRILHVVTHMNRGGLETMLMNYYRKIDRTKVQFDFLVHRQERADYDDVIESLGGKIYRLPYLNPFSRGYLRALDAFFEEHREYRIVHSHLDCMSAIPLKVAKKHGVPVRIAHSHTSSQDINLKYPLKLYYKTRIKNYATDLFACSEKAGKWMFGTDNFKILPNAIDVKQYLYDSDKRKKKREELKVGNAFVVGNVSRFSKVKNHKFLIDILSELLKIDNNVKLILVGEGEEYEKIKCLVKNRGLSDNVIFTGLRSDVFEIMQAFDVFVLPSLYEGLPVTMVEAQAAGLPCFISDGVPIDCKITDDVYRISLDKGDKEWAEQIYTMRNFDRKNTYSKIVDAHFDIIQNAKYLQNFYMEQWELVEEGR